MTTQDQTPAKITSKNAVDRTDLIHSLIGNERGGELWEAEGEIFWRFLGVVEFGLSEDCKDNAERAHAKWALDEIELLARDRARRLENLPEPVEHPV